MRARVGVVTVGAAVIVGTMVAGLLVGPLGPRAAVIPVSAPTMLALSALGLLMTTLAAILLLRRPDNRMGWVFGGMAAMIALSLFSDSYLHASFAGGGQPLPGALAVGAATSWGPAGFWLLISLLLLLFPTGRVASRRWRPFARVMIGVYVVAMLLMTVGSGPVIDGGPMNPLSVRTLVSESVAGIVDMAGTIFWIASNLLVVIAASSLVVRFRSAQGIEREQLKWLAFSGLLVVAGGAAMLGAAVSGHGEHRLSVIGGVVFGAGLISVPIFATLAILRYRLYDIDRIISRTVSYALITGVLGGLYVVAVFVLSALVASVGGESQITVAGATLAVAAAFRPVRARVQALVDRRFNRRRYDAQRTVRAFAERLRDRVDVDEVGADLLATTIGVVAPSNALLWMPDATQAKS